MSIKRWKSHAEFTGNLGVYFFFTWPPFSAANWARRRARAGWPSSSQGRLRVHTSASGLGCQVTQHILHTETEEHTFDLDHQEIINSHSKWRRKLGESAASDQAGATGRSSRSLNTKRLFYIKHESLGRSPFFRCAVCDCHLLVGSTVIFLFAHPEWTVNGLRYIHLFTRCWTEIACKVPPAH